MAVPARWFTAADRIAEPWRRLEDDAADMGDPTRPARQRRLAADLDREASRLADDTRNLVNDLLAAVWTAAGGRNATTEHAQALAALTNDTGNRITATADLFGPAIAAGRRRPASARVHATIAAAVTAAHNLAVLNVARAAGVELAVISDGPGCGLTGHDDGQDADGLVVTLEVAAAYPLSHPQCRREVAPFTGPAPAQVLQLDPETLAAAPGGFARFLTASPPSPAVTGGRAARSPRSVRAARSGRTARTARGSRA